MTTGKTTALTRWTFVDNAVKVKEESEEAGLKLNIQKMKIMASSPTISREIDGETGNRVRLYFLGAPKSLQMVIAAMKLKDP